MICLLKNMGLKNWAKALDNGRIIFNELKLVAIQNDFVRFFDLQLTLI